MTTAEGSDLLPELHLSFNVRNYLFVIITFVITSSLLLPSLYGDLPKSLYSD
ncbi:hypothetical protein MM326_13695 [Alkalihalobacillus sp. LMS6]|uniref:hypothetical protein n=1 Tax=Alkalihalobacillus sp. LMS6 TaxID=2924034 RepID=UPI0020D036F3|nr:hypothetical protein [Alkalihalobacillus sp. LMS6]UTR05161.1 hypothetical protein MM326_13695 [Alkalihalobacillus sp. LMS6]